MILHMQQLPTVLPLPIASGEASEVKLAWLGTQVPSGRLHAGWGQWQNPGKGVACQVIWDRRLSHAWLQH